VRRSTPPYDAVISVPFGLVGIRMRGETLAAVDLRPAIRGNKAPSSAAARKVAAALRRYFEDPANTPCVRMDSGGTPFQRRVWRALRKIPPGTTITYGALAQKLRTSARAVGGACRENPLPIVVPCHRVVAADGAGGFMGRSGGRALDIKSWLLRHEAGIGAGERHQER
jgi:methylated-DNA-[protein]-cysteine S-methyltransferase